MKRVQILLKVEKKMNDKKHRFLWTLAIGVLLSIGKTPGAQVRGRIFSFLFGVIAALVASQASAQTAVMRLTANNTYRGRLRITMVALMVSPVALLPPGVPSVEAQATPPQ